MSAYQQNVVDELTELNRKRDEIEAMLRAADGHRVSEIVLLSKQSVAMHLYAMCLVERIALMGEETYA